MRSRIAAVALVLATLAVVTPPAAAAPAFHGSTGGLRLNEPVVGMAAAPDGRGYWLVARDGGVFSFGSARFFGSTGGLRLNQPVVGMAAAPDGRGYWLVARDGGVFSFGSARFHGSTGAIRLRQPIVDMAAAPDGRGYWLVARDGGVFSFGSARFHGSWAGSAGAPVVGIAARPAGGGYWLATEAGRVRAFGGANFAGDASNRATPRTVAVLAAPRGGYVLVGVDGGVTTFGGAPFHGSTGGSRLNAPMIGGAFAPDGTGYWLLGADGGIFTFPGTPPPPGGRPALQVSTVASGLSIPWDLAFLPGGAMLFTERGGRISAVVGGGVRVLATLAEVRSVGEGGLTGLAVDPQFATNRHVYTCLNHTSGDVRVVKWLVDAAVTGLTRVGDLVTGIPAIASGRHSGCRLRFGVDGHLWIGTGDAATGTTPQDLGSLGGKVLRVHKVTGQGVPGNLTGRILTYGHRNVQGLAFRPGSLQAFAVEHGPTRDDEVNRIVGGGNYGWDPVPGYNEAVPMTDLAKFPGARRATWSSGAPPIAPSGATFVTGRAWRDWNGALVLAALRGQQLRVLVLDASGQRVVAQATALTTFGRLRTPVQGPDGSLYVTTSNGGGTDRILRVTPS